MIFLIHFFSHVEKSDILFLVWLMLSAVTKALIFQTCLGQITPYFCPLFKETCDIAVSTEKEKQLNSFPALHHRHISLPFSSWPASIFTPVLWDYSSYHNPCWSFSAFCVCWCILLLIWNIWMEWPLIWLASAVVFFFFFFPLPASFKLLLRLQRCSDGYQLWRKTDKAVSTSHSVFLLCFMQHNKRLLTK